MSNVFLLPALFVFCGLTCCCVCFLCVFGVSLNGHGLLCRPLPKKTQSKHSSWITPLPLRHDSCLTCCLFTLSFTPFPSNSYFLHISFTSVPSPAPHQFSLLSSLYSSAVALTPFLSVSFSSELCHPRSKRRVRGICTLQEPPLTVLLSADKTDTDSESSIIAWLLICRKKRGRRCQLCWGRSIIECIHHAQSGTTNSWRELVSITPSKALLSSPSVLLRYILSSYLLTLVSSLISPS